MGQRAENSVMRTYKTLVIGSRFKGIFSTLAIVVFLTSCSEPASLKESAENPAQTQPVSEEPKLNSARALIDEAELVHAESKGLSHAWIKTQQLMDEAENLLASGDEANAVIVARRALFVAKASLSQAIKEGQSWQSRVPN
jgi:hypothetical protein